ncbi:alpha/beta fold hydrolase [Nocardia alni]|uniref:alpha/beta fold hydrolase n=1 Tax=Nocardia alni TaxID=2815723 RepID=UPI001C24309E|nr:alpha/beta fold hydrolase [Nocardia alni]
MYSSSGKFTRPVSAAAATVGMAVAAVCAVAHPAAADIGRASCRTVQIPVTIPGVPAPGRITGDYCVPLLSNGTILLTAGGGAENASYWNMPGLDSYSLIDAAATEGYATLAIDRLGTGRSTIPSSSTLVTYQAIVSATHEVAVALRRGQAGIDRQWHSIAGIGHSLGSGTIAGLAAADPTDLDAIILTGYGPAVSPETTQLNALYQVAASTVFPQYADLDSGYRTVIPNDVGVAGSFYLPDTSSEALAAQGKYEGLLSTTELSTRPQGSAAESQGATIKVPAFVVDGQQDRHYCEDNAINDPPSIGVNCATQQAFNAYEQPLLPNACLATSVVPNAGHALQLEENAPDTNRLLLGWLRATFGRNRVSADSPAQDSNPRCAVTGPFAGP